MNFEQLVENTIRQYPEVWDRSFYSSGSDYANIHHTSLQGFPKKVMGDFAVNENHLTSLEGGPTYVKGSYYCNGNRLTSLEGAPDYVGENFDCSQNPDLPLLELARVDLGKKVKGKIIVGTFENRYAIHKTKCTRAYYDAVKATGAEEQQDITNI